jgi:6-phosphogluconolactonase
LTYPALESSRVTAFLVVGAQKADAVRRARGGDVAIPAGALSPAGDVIWFLDAAAAGGGTRAGEHDVRQDRR